nr:ribonuclease H-like domain-containing protein [Tanacetum cinerariifolium]
MQKRINDVKARTTLLLALPDEHQLRFSKYETAKELWEAILKTFSGNEATKKTKKNQLKQQYGNLKVEGSETLEQTFNRLQAIVGHLEFMNMEIEQDDLNPKFLTSLAPEWIMYTIVWRNRDDLDTMSLDDVYNHLKEYEPEVQKKSESNSQNMAFVSSANTSSGKCDINTTSIPTASTQVSTASADVVAVSISHDTVCAYIASQSNGSQIKYKDITQINEDDIEEIDIKWNMALLNRSRREKYKQGSREEEPDPKALMAIDGIGWDWSYMVNEEENHALVADDEAPTEFALMDKSSSSSENEKEKDSLDSKLTGFESASKDLDTLLGSQRTDKNKEGLGYSAIPPTCSTGSLTVIKTNKVETARKPSVKYVEMYRNTSKSPKVRGNQRNWNNLKSQQLGKDFLMKNKACFKCGHFYHLAYDYGVWVEKEKNWPKNNFAHKNVTPRADLLKIGRTPIAVNRTKMNGAQPKRTFFTKTAHSYVRRPFQRKSAVRTQFQVLRNSIVNINFPTVDSKFSTASTANLGNKGKGNSQNNIDDKGYWESGCSRHMTGNISYLSEYEPFDGGYVSFGQGGGKITGKGKDLKLKDDTNVLLRIPRQHNMYSIDLNNIVPHKDLTCLVVKASADESMLWHRRLCHLNFKTMNNLVRNNLVNGLPYKCFENNHTCVACLKGKQHKASCKTKRTPYIGFLGPFGCYVMILNTLDHLRKFDAKGDEDEPACPVRDVSEGEACLTESGFIADQDRATIAKSSTLPHDSAPRVTSPAADEGSMQHNIFELTALCTSLQ